MKTISLTYENGKYYAPVSITVEQWKEMLNDAKIFDGPSMRMVINWYNQPFHQGTSKEVMAANGINGNTPYNGIVCGLGKRIIKHLNSFEIIDTGGSGKSYFIIPFEGWHVDYKPYKLFVWKLRDELVIALEQLGIVTNNSDSSVPDDSENFSLAKRYEGEKKSYYTSRYERDPINRINAIKIHGTKCQLCGFDFEEMYGLFGKGFIEVHHIRPLCEQQSKTEIDPANDLICVCANCHRMIHRLKHDTLSPKQLKAIIQSQRNKTQQ